ncbi:response regulator transcription factor [Petrocella sp. FN5]|uniref:response regulator transcription factor n=1 Tax=Petrocella sp. FN5 TaxID=3032002 RepID=UPI0023DA80F9|nr:response regulator transcription factor [Petrocella sp. FN5]MDF1616088.1 response regulator transcription factor [Petrocella sp. FN5]
MKYQIMMVEDQKDIRDIVVKYLEKEDYEVLIAEDGFLALELFSQSLIHLVLLDIMMPGIDGFEVLKEIRKISDVPVIMLTAKKEEIDRIKGFDQGADDYVLKPFSPRELMGRIKVLLKRVYHESETMVYRFKDLSLHMGSMKLYKNQEEITITSAEYGLLCVFFKNQGQVLSREQLIRLAYGQNYEGYDRNIDSYIKRIRQKIEVNPKKPEILITKYGAGYMFGGK